jgi:hypothetical protein
LKDKIVEFTKIQKKTKDIQSKIKTRSRNHRRGGKAKSVTYFECMSVSVPWLRSMHCACAVHTVTCGLSGHTTHFSIIISNGAVFRKKLSNIKRAY